MSLASQLMRAILIGQAALALPASAQQMAPAPEGDATLVSEAAITNPDLGLNLAPVADQSTQQPFIDVMKAARLWTAEPDAAGGSYDFARLQADGWLDEDGWPVALPPGVTGITTVMLTDLPEAARELAGRYRADWQGKGTIELGGRATNIRADNGGLSFDFTPGEGAVLLSLTQIDPEDPVRNITVMRADHRAAWEAGMIFSPDWLDRLRGTKLLRFTEWMATRDSKLAHLADSPRLSDFSWMRGGVPLEAIVMLANELDAEPWFSIPHLADDELVRFYAETVEDLLEPDLRSWVEFSGEVWNWQYDQARWAEDQGKARWNRDGTWLQFYALRAAEVSEIWTDVFGADASDRLVRVVSTLTGQTGIEEQILGAPLVVAEGLPAPATAFDAYAVSGYFAAFLGAAEKQPMLKAWLAESAAADPSAPYALALTRATEELRDGRHSGQREDTLEDLLQRVLPYHAEIASKNGLKLVMYEGGSHVAGYGAVTDDPDMTRFFETLNYSPQMGKLYGELLAGWTALSDAPFNAYVGLAGPTRWGSWGALRYLDDDNPRWRALARGCDPC